MTDISATGPKELINQCIMLCIHCVGSICVGDLMYIRTYTCTCTHVYVFFYTLHMWCLLVAKQPAAMQDDITDKP